MTKKTKVDPDEYTDDRVEGSANTEINAEATKQTDTEVKVEQEKPKAFATESFNVDHTKVTAPYVRIASTKVGKKGDTVVKYDVRFCQPNFECMSTGTIHTLEHLIAEIMHSSFENVIDVSPMGCRTGFYITMFDGVKEETMAQVMVQVLQKVAIWNGDIPGATAQTCGNYKDHDIIGAKKQAMMFIGGIMSKGYGA